MQIAGEQKRRAGLYFRLISVEISLEPILYPLKYTAPNESFVADSMLKSITLPTLNTLQRGRRFYIFFFVFFVIVVAPNSIVVTVSPAFLSKGRAKLYPNPKLANVVWEIKT